MVAAHKKFPMPEDSRLYMPVLVGAKENYIHGIDYQRDDDGENISIKNPNYNELTAVYWAWKNLRDVDAVGLVQYRRLLCSKKNKHEILSKQEIVSLLKNNDVILPKKRKYYIETNYSHYMHAHHVEPIKTVRAIIVQEYPEYICSFDKVMNRRGAHMFNMFVMKKGKFDEYAKWLFGILQEAEKRIDISTYSTQESRVYGYISELLMDVWIEKNNIDYTEVAWKQLGEKHYFKKVFYFIYRKFGSGVGKTHF